MQKLFAMLPCYNEAKDISSLVKKWVDLTDNFNKRGYDLQIYCVDDKSIDETNAVICKLEKEFSQRVHLIEHEVNKGLGGVLMTCFNFFQTNGREGDVLVLMDGDNTHDPIYVLDMLLKIEDGNDCVIASRYCSTSETKGVSPLRLFMSWGARFFYSIILGVKNVKDYTCGYRAYSYFIINSGKKKFGNELVERRSFACMMEALYKLSLVGARFAEVPFELRYDNKQGESKMRVLKTIRESIGTAINLRFGN